MARLLVVGLIITIVVLGINYFTAIRRNTETSRELSRVMFELGNVSKKLDVEIKRNSEMIADLHKHEIKMKEKITSLNAELSAAKNDMKAERQKLQEMERKCHMKASVTRKPKAATGTRKISANQL